MKCHSNLSILFTVVLSVSTIITSSEKQPCSLKKALVLCGMVALMQDKVATGLQTEVCLDEPVMCPLNTSSAWNSCPTLSLPTALTTKLVASKIIHEPKISDAEDRLSTYKKRYPQNFGTFLARTNEKEVSKNIILTFMNKLAQSHPEYLKTGIRMYDIGCGNGEFSSQLVESLSSLIPEGAKNISFAGMDWQPDFIKDTNRHMHRIGIMKPQAVVGNIKHDQVRLADRQSANFVLASHSAYIFSDMTPFIKRLKVLMDDNGIAILLHGNDTPIDTLRRKFKNFLKPATTNDTPSTLRNAFRHAGLTHYEFQFNPTIQFPKLSEKDWKDLCSITSLDYSATYKHFTTRAQETKQLIEFFLQDPLEAFTRRQRKQLLKEFRILLDEHDYGIPLSNYMQVVLSPRHSSALKHAAKQSLHATHQAHIKSKS